MLREINNQDILTLILLGCLLVITITKLLFPKRFNEFVALLIDSRHSSLYARDQRFFDIFKGLFFLNFVLNIALTVYLFIHNLTLEITTQISIFKYALIIAVLMILKIVFERLLSSILSIEIIVVNYLFYKTSYRNFTGLILLPFNALLLYSITPDKTLFLVIFIILAIIFFYGIFLFLKNNLNIFKQSFFYFILYLCTLEIAPYIVLYRFIVPK